VSSVEAELHLGSTRGPQASPQIPYFLVELISIDGEKWLEVTCGRCKRLFMVKPRSWATSLPTHNYTRPCPYCFKAGRIPKLPSERRRKK
jgi:hypothetical protein